MNSSQWLVIILITALIFIMIGVGLHSVEDLSKNNELIFKLILGLGCSFIILSWFFIVFLIDVYITIGKTRNETKQMQQQIHSDIMKKYTEDCSK